MTSKVGLQFNPYGNKIFNPNDIKFNCFEPNNIPFEYRSLLCSSKSKNSNGCDASHIYKNTCTDKLVNNDK